MGKLSSQPLISALLVNKNHGAYIENAIESVLEQSYQNIELIIGDGCSTDGTLNILQKYQDDPRVSWFSEPDQNAFHALNKLLDRAKGGIVGLMTSTDTYLPGAFEGAVNEFQKDSYVAMIGGGLKHIRDDSSEDVAEQQRFTGTIFCTEPVNLSLDEVVSFVQPPFQSTFLRRDLIELIGGVPLEFSTCHTIFYLHYLLEAYQRGNHARVVPEYWGTFRRGHKDQGHLKYQGMPYAKERLLACRKYAHQYRSFLSYKQRRLLLKAGFYREFMTRVYKSRELFLAFPSALKYIWFGGHLKDVLSYFYTHLIRRRWYAKLANQIRGRGQN